MHFCACKDSLFIRLVAAFYSGAQGSIYSISSSHFPPPQPFVVVWVERESLDRRHPDNSFVCVRTTIGVFAFIVQCLNHYATLIYGKYLLVYF